MSSALFGPDGTQLPEPAAVLPDALVSPSATTWSSPLTPPAGAPALPDLPDFRQAISDALGAVPSDALPTPPDGFPVHAPPPARPIHPARPQLAHRPPPRRPQPPRQPQPHQALRPARPPQAYAPAQGLPRRPARTHRKKKNPLVGAKSTGAGGWVGCLVVLVFVGAVTFNLIVALITAVLDAFR